MLARAVAVVGVPTAGTLAVAAAWWAATSPALLGVEAYLLPAPGAVAATFTRLPGYLADATRVTAVEVAAGFGLAAAGGITVGVALASSRLIARALYPTLVALHSVPKLALAPAMIVTLGFGTAPKVVMVVLVCTFPIVLSTATGLARTPAELVELTRSLSASWWQTLLKLRLPNALPHMFVGLKQAAPLAVIGAVVGELFGAVAGLGYTVRIAGSDTALTGAAILLLAAMSLTLFYGLVAAERLLVPWTRHTTA